MNSNTDKNRRVSDLFPTLAEAKRDRDFSGRRGRRLPTLLEGNTWPNSSIATNVEALVVTSADRIDYYVIY